MATPYHPSRDTNTLINICALSGPFPPERTDADKITGLIRKV